jgi:membrane-bound serine protease (ClpP class)
MRVHSFVKLAALLLFAMVARFASADVVKIVIDDTIHPMAAEYVDRAVQQARDQHADALLIEINTPGGLMTSMEAIVHAVLDSPVPVIVFVTPSGGKAASAGFFILEAADVAAMTPGTNTGAAHPVLPGTIMDPVMKEKVENYAASLMRSYVTKRGRNVEVAESAVRQSKSFTADEALKDHVIDYIARSQNDLFQQLDGKTITRFDGSKVVLHLAGKPIHLFEKTLKQKILTVLMDPNVTFIILAIGMLSIYFEFNHPGAIVPGVVGFIAILLALYALNLLPFRSISLVLILAAFLMFGLEAKFQTHGILTTGGIAVMVLGALLLVDGPIPQMRVSWWAALSVSIPFGLITAFLLTIAMRARRNKAVMGAGALIGELAIAQSPLTPSGKVYLRGELWDAVAGANVHAGGHVVVRQVENLVLHVDPAPEAPPSSRGA